MKEQNQPTTASDDAQTEVSPVTTEEPELATAASATEQAAEIAPTHTTSTASATMSGRHVVDRHETIDKPKRSGGLVGGLALLVSLAVAGGGYWLHQRLMRLEQDQRQGFDTQLDTALQEYDQRLVTQLTGVDASLSELRAGMALEAERLREQGDADRLASQQALNSLESRLTTLEGQQARVDGLQNRIDVLVERIESLRREQQPTLMLRWQAAHDLLSVGRIQVLRQNDVRGATEHYEAARELLLTQADEGSAQAIAALDGELQRLRAQPVLDTTQFEIRLGQALIDLAGWVPFSAHATDLASDEDAGWWQRLKDIAKRGVRVRRAEALDAIDSEALRQAVRLHLLALQGALIVHDGPAVGRHVNAVEQLLQQYGVSDDTALSETINLLAEVRGLDFSPPPPSLGQAEQHLQQLLSAARAEVNS